MLFYIGMPVVRTDGRSVARSVYGHVIAKFSRMGTFGWVDYQPRPQGLKPWGRGWVDYHISLAMRVRAWISAISHNDTLQ